MTMAKFLLLLCWIPLGITAFTATPSSARGGMMRTTTTNLHSTTAEAAETITTMPPPLPKELKNEYYFLRHGQSTANVAGIISSARSLAYSTKHGLTDVGVEQGKASATILLELLLLSSSKKKNVIQFVTSPFARAEQTAKACQMALKELTSDSNNLQIAQEIVYDDRLMERYFGRLDGEALYTYAYVWPMDKMNPTHKAFDVESVAEVCTRFRDFIMDMETKYDNTSIVMASHADVCQISQLYAANVDNVGEFSSYRFANGEVRKMEDAPESLPSPVPLEAPKRGTALFTEQQFFLRE